MFNKSNITIIKKSINQIKNFEFDLTRSLNMIKLIAQQRKNIKNKQKLKKQNVKKKTQFYYLQKKFFRSNKLRFYRSRRILNHCENEKN